MADAQPDADKKVSPSSGGSGDAGDSKPSNEPVSLENGRGGILGVKAGMTQVYTSEGSAVAVTVIDLQPNVITQVKTKEKDGYQGVQVGFLGKREKRVGKPEKGHVKKVPGLSGQSGFYHYQEFRAPKDASLEGVEAGKTLSASFLKEGDLVDLTSVSKGKGFQGTMKRHNFGGLCRSHGVSISHRSGGSIGNRTDPGRVFKGKKMAGHMGHKKVTVQNVKVVRVDLDRNILLVNGSVPGPRSGIVTVRRAVKHLSNG